MNSRTRFSFPFAAAAVGVFLAVGCASSGGRATGASAAAASSTAAVAPAYGFPSSASGGAPVARMASAPACTATQLTIQYTDNPEIRGGALAGPSKADQVITFTNHSARSCETSGYPGVAAVNSAGTRIMQAVQTTEADTLIILPPGFTVSALVTASTASCDSLTSVVGLLVTAPSLRTSVRLGPAGKFCLNSLAVGPVKPGNAAGLML